MRKKSPSTTLLRSSLALVVLLASVGWAEPGDAQAGEAQAGEEQAGEQCAAWQLDYSLNARLKVTDTPMGAGDGIYSIGPGRLRLVVGDQGGKPGGEARLTKYRMKTHFRVESSVLGFGTKVTTKAATRATPKACGAAATGKLQGTKLRFSAPVSGYRTDGTLHCSGSMCGKFGAPPEGESPLHEGPAPVRFESFVFGSSKLDTFTMQYSKVSQSSTNTTYLTLAGRQIKKKCLEAKPKPCP